MNRVAIWGSDKWGKEIFDLLNKENDKYTVVAFVDKNVEKQGKIINRIEVLEPQKVVKMAEQKLIDTVIFAFNNVYLREPARMFRNCNVKAYLVPLHRARNRSIDSWDQLIEFDVTKPRLQHLEFNITSHCNLNCKGCLQVCNLVTTPGYADYSIFMKDFRRIREIFEGVDYIKIMGGEPLLSKDVCKYVEGVRNIFPESYLEITTNGLLISERCQELFEVMRRYDCIFDISLYKVLEKRLPEIKKLLEKENIPYVINESKETFYKMLSPEGKYDMCETYKGCAGRECHHLNEGKLAVCSLPHHVHLLNEHFGTKLPTEAGKFDIYDEEIDNNPWGFEEKLNSAFGLCKYCGNPVHYEWDRADAKNAKYEDWFIE